MTNDDFETWWTTKWSAGHEAVWMGNDDPTLYKEVAKAAWDAALASQARTTEKRLGLPVDSFSHWIVGHTIHRTEDGWFQCRTCGSQASDPVGMGHTAMKELTESVRPPQA